ncbi:glucose-6-phosphate dehydrogenase assembly protein OpcA [Actinobacteria bacterium YIM 96077]|uniref:Glucose-6-phosphate dehydrogenase assembly protein OpcA n=1 Tax=Phytoactinopolyspora halophila TaxID=1981511 RepID=A0A329QMS0_9ACTN|nr:glucose-6-phosphate dehydrogenase assembly protein OpcA [Phytoactinopolyspora halophila]AYY12926.1 glucose-6-phosphate dehydrogenase assembly protein OpcA [Actinobacteria bacterium YIM 96077]RAW13640.1 glucose-6-phosphate dehydrogenase assembly protein OpcA [Phytoactinopolyspora halophila]
MIIDLPSTTAGSVGKRLVDLREKHGAVTLGRVLTLVLIADEDDAEDAIASANHASHEHPCRILAVIRGTSRGATRLDAQIRVGGDAGASEVIVLRTFGPLTAHPVSVVMPLLLPDAPLVAWWPAEAPDAPAEDPVGALAQRRITDAACCKRPIAALQDRVASYRPGDTDLAWTRLTLWRALLAAALDQPPYEDVTAARVVGGTDNPSADLLAGWLALTLDCPVTRTKASGVDGMLSVRLDRASGPIVLERQDEPVAVLSMPGRTDRQVALPRRSAGECLAEELRRLEPDDVYGDVLTTGLEIQRETGKVTRTKARR